MPVISKQTVARKGAGRGPIARASLAVLIILFGALMTSCGASPSPTATAPAPVARPIDTTNDLMAALRAAAGRAVTDAGAVDDHFGVAGEAIMVGDETIEVYAFPDSASRKTAQSEIDPDSRTFQGQPLTGWSQPRIWGIGRLLVVYDGSQGGTFLLISGLLGDPITLHAAAPGADEPYPPAVSAAIGALAATESLDPLGIQVVSYEPAVWPDGCLGLPDDGESCDTNEVEGWRVVLRVDGMVYEVRTDQLGQRIRWSP
jgi:hypothetical protein